MKDVLISTNEAKFIVAALKDKQRIDGRGMHDFRQRKILFGNERGHAEVTCGRTRVIAQCSSEVVVPLPERPTEGMMKFSVELSPMAAQVYASRKSDTVVELVRILERSIRVSRAVDCESLCIVAGEKVWMVRVDVTVLDDDGNIEDATMLAALASLHHFRRPFVSVSGEDVKIHTLEEHVPVALTVHHRSLSATFAFIADGALCVVDPTYKEEAVSVSTVTITMNAHREICAIHKMGGVELHADQLLECVKIAYVKVVELTKILEDALKADETKRQSAVWSRAELKKLTKTSAPQEHVAAPVRDTHAAADDDDAVLEEPVATIQLLNPTTAVLFEGTNAWDEQETPVANDGKKKSKKKKQISEEVASTDDVQPDPIMEDDAGALEKVLEEDASASLESASKKKKEKKALRIAAGEEQ